MTLMMSVSGIRGIIGSTMTPHLALAAGQTLAAWTGGGRVVVGRDSRPSGEMLQAAVMSGLLAGGCDVIDVGIVPTPTVALMVTETAADAGIVLTASHNPSMWNGIKFLTATGNAPPPPVAREILDLLEAGAGDLAPVERIRPVTRNDDALRCHVQKVLAIVDTAAIRDRGFRVVLDSVHGAGGPAGRMLLDALGCTVVHQYAEPNGQFPRLPEPTADHLQELCERTASEKADVGFAQDPDADRLAMVDETGRYIGEEYSLSIAAQEVLREHAGPVAANLSTSRMIDDVVAAMTPAPIVHRTPVGEANVVACMRDTHCVIGGEGNGGVIDPRVVYVRDSLTAMALTLQALAIRGCTLGELTATMPRYVMIKQKFDCSPGDVTRVLDAVRERFNDEPVNDADGLRIDWPQGWVHIRPSNTEPVMRVISEAADDTTAQALVHRVREVADAVRKG